MPRNKDHIDQVIEDSLRYMRDVAKGELGVKKAKAAAANARNALFGMNLALQAQQDKYRTHNVTWLRKRK